MWPPPWTSAYARLHKSGLHRLRSLFLHLRMTRNPSCSAPGTDQPPTPLSCANAHTFTLAAGRQREASERGGRGAQTRRRVGRDRRRRADNGGRPLTDDGHQTPSSVTADAPPRHCHIRAALAASRTAHLRQPAAVRTGRRLWTSDVTVSSRGVSRTAAASRGTDRCRYGRCLHGRAAAPHARNVLIR